MVKATASLETAIRYTVGAISHFTAATAALEQYVDVVKEGPGGPPASATPQRT